MKSSKKATCSKCDQPLEANRIGRHCYCLACNSVYVKETRIKHKDLPDDVRKRLNAHCYLNVYISRGKITREGCEVCNDRARAFIPDITKPLVVQWLCKKHMKAPFKRFGIDSVKHQTNC